jgi:hypothetical protein
VNPSEIPGLDAYPMVKQMFEQHLDMQFSDLRTMLQLPIPPELPGGCNFAGAAVLMNVIGGCSVVLYNDPYPGMPAATVPQRRGDRFCHLVSDYLPHDPALEPPKARTVEVLYSFARNSLTHALGLRQPAREPVLSIAKARLTPVEIELLEREQQRPRFLRDPIVREPTAGSYELSVAALYWGTYRVLEALVGEPAHMRHAEQELQRGTWTP